MDDPRSSAATATARCHLWVSGVVQGVGFRFFTERVARRLGLSGVVRNLPDGRVEIVAEGPRAALDQLIAEVRRGPVGAVVTGVRVEWEPPAGLSGFRIL
jgi:acylphosphatase